MHLPAGRRAPVSAPRAEPWSVAQARIVLDCDPGVDDAMALLYGLRSTDIDIVAVCTVWGNAPVGVTTENALCLLELAGRDDVPVAMGAANPLIGSAHTFGTGPHGEDGLGGVTLPPHRGAPIGTAAAAELGRLAREHPGELTLVTLGPLTNVALALQADPGVAQLYRGVVIMGGAVLAPGNLTPVAEINIGHDPEAAQIVFDAGWPITLVGLDVTEHVRVSQAHFNDLRDNAGSLGESLYRMSHRYLSFYERRYSKRECPMHDALVLGIAADRSLIRESQHTRVDVEQHGEHTRGMTVAELRPGIAAERPNVTVVRECDGARFIGRWMDTLCGVATPTPRA